MSKDLISVLNEQGLEIEKIDSSEEEDLLEDGYIKLDKTAIEQLDSFLQYIPNIVGDAVTRTDATKNAAKLLDGAYKVSIKDGMHLAKYKDAQGGYLGGLLSNETNKVSGQARWFKIGDKLTITKAPQFAMGVFNALSVATGQYYLAEINSKLKSIDVTTKQIVSYLDNKTKGELWAYNESLNEIIKNLKFIDENEALKAKYEKIITDVKNNSLAKMKHFELEIESKRKNINKSSSDKEIQAYVSDTVKYYPQYWFSVFLYVKSVNCELILDGITDPDYIENKLEDVKKYVEGYELNYKKDKDRMLNIVTNAKAYNRLELDTIKFSTHGELPVLDVIVGLYDAFALGKNYHAEKMSDKGSELLGKVKGEMKECGNTTVFDDGIQRIIDYKNYTNSPVELVAMKDEIYVKYKELDTED